MTTSKRLLAIAMICCALLAISSYESVTAQTISVTTEYVMTVYLDIKGRFTNGNLRVVDIPGGWIEGPHIKGKIIAPSGDWFTPLPSGVGRIGVRLIVQTDDDQSYTSPTMVFSSVPKKVRADYQEANCSKLMTATSLWHQPSKRLRNGMAG